MDELGARDWRRAQAMRAAFLDSGSRAEGGVLPDYWTSRRDLEIYDATFGARIGWKWEAVSRELALRRIVPPCGVVVDWGTGTGIAARCFARRFGAGIERMHLVDRSAGAVAFARERSIAEHPLVALADEFAPIPAEIDVLLVSHVLGELDARGWSELSALARRSRWIACVDAGTHAVARRLSALRDELLGDFDPLAPCTHRAACGMLAPEHSASWCHHFARPPAEAHRSRHWARFSHELGIDLRSLPYAFLVLSRRVAPDERDARTDSSDGCAASGGASSAVRILGRPRLEKASARLDVCGRDGVHVRTLLAREDRELFKSLDAVLECPVFECRVEGSRLRDMRRAFAEPTAARDVARRGEPSAERGDPPLERDGPSHGESMRELET